VYLRVARRTAMVEVPVTVGSNVVEPVGSRPVEAIHARAATGNPTTEGGMT
jgi:hypothetical protein